MIRCLVLLPPLGERRLMQMAYADNLFSSVTNAFNAAGTLGDLSVLSKLSAMVA